MTSPHRRRHPVLAHLPFGLVMAVVALGLARIMLYHWREGTVLMGAALVLAAGLRVLLSDEQAGLIVIRSRGIDALTYTIFGVCMMAVALTIDN
ncbi:DUF3017 domain-containing protein [Actinophytocola sediminis]